MRVHYLLPSLVVLFAAGSAFGGVIDALGQTSTAGFSTGVATGETPRGWDFTVNSAGVVVSQFGVNAATSTAITVTLWNDSTQTELAQLVVDSTANAWVFGSLGTSVALTLGDTYSVIGWADTTGSTPWYLFNNTPPAAFNPTGTIQYIDTRYDNGIDANTFPEFTIPSPAQYGVVDIGYSVATPEPMSLALTGAGMTLLFALRRRRKV